MKRFITYGSIDQFRTIVKNVQHSAQYIRYDEEAQEPIMDRNAEMPTITAIGSEKIHGSNAGFSYNEIDKEWFQSRKNIITPEKDNAGCAFFMESKKELLTETVKHIASVNNIDLTLNGIVLFGEWCGGNIQKKSCFTGLDKRFVIFRHAKVYEIEPTLNEQGEEFRNYWIETKLS